MNGNALTFPDRKLISENGEWKKDMYPVDTIVKNFEQWRMIWAGNTIGMQSPEAKGRLIGQGVQMGCYFYTSIGKRNDPGSAFTNDQMLKNGDWFVADYQGKLIPFPGQDDAYYFDPRNSDAVLAATANAVAASEGYTHLSADICCIGAERMKSITTHNPTWTYAGREEFYEARFMDYLAYLKKELNKAGRKLTINLSCNPLDERDADVWNAIDLLCDVVMMENRVHPYLEYIKHSQKIIDKGVEVWWVSEMMGEADVLAMHNAWEHVHIEDVNKDTYITDTSDSFNDIWELLI